MSTDKKQLSLVHAKQNVPLTRRRTNHPHNLRISVPAFSATRKTGRSPFLVPLPRVPKPRGSAITRSDAFAVVVAKLGFKPLSSAGRETRMFPAGNGQGWPICREPCPLAERIKALVWHVDRMARGRVSRNLSAVYRPINRIQ